MCSSCELQGVQYSFSNFVSYSDLKAESECFPVAGVSYKTDQIRDFKRIYGQLHPDIRPVCVCGNHDVGDVPTGAAIEAYRQDFGDEYFSFWVQGCKFLVINSQLYHDSSLVPNYKRWALGSFLARDLLFVRCLWLCSQSIRCETLFRVALTEF